MRLSNRKNKLVVFIASFLFLLVTAVSTVEARKGDRRAAGFSSKGPASSGSFKKHKKRKKQQKKAYRKAKDRKRERREDRRDYKQERREDRRDYRKERHERHERRENRRTVRRVAGAVALGAVAYNALKCRHEEFVIDGYVYSRCGNKWYEPVHRGGEVTYIVVETPDGY